MKNGPIKIGGRRSLPNYEHVVAEFEVHPEPDDNLEDVLGRASMILEKAFGAAQDAVKSGGEGRPAKPAAAEPAATPVAQPKPATSGTATAGKPIITPPVTKKSPDESRMARENFLRKHLAEIEVSEGELLAVAKVPTITDLPGIRSDPMTAGQIKAMVAGLVAIMNADPIPT